MAVLSTAVGDAGRALPPGGGQKPAPDGSGPVIGVLSPAVSRPHRSQPKTVTVSKGSAESTNRAQETTPVLAQAAQQASPVGGHEAKLSTAPKKVERRRDRTRQSHSQGCGDSDNACSRAVSATAASTNTTTTEAGSKSSSSRNNPDEGEAKAGGSKDERKRPSSSENPGKAGRSSSWERQQHREGGREEASEPRRREGSRRDPHRRSERNRDPTTSQQQEQQQQQQQQSKATSPIFAVMAPWQELSVTAVAPSPPPLPPRPAAATAVFGSRYPEDLRLVVEFVGSVESVARIKAVCAGWRQAVKGHEDRLFKLVVRRAGVTPKRRAAFWEHMVLRR